MGAGDPGWHPGARSTEWGRASIRFLCTPCPPLPVYPKAGPSGLQCQLESSISAQISPAALGAGTERRQHLPSLLFVCCVRAVGTFLLILWLPLSNGDSQALYPR